MLDFNILVNKDIICDIDEFKLELTIMPEDDRLDWDGVDLGDGKNYHIQVWFNESNIPHFHLISNDGTVETAICIFEPRYYFHRPELTSLTNNQIKKLLEYLNSFHGSETRWNGICTFWIAFNENRNYLFKETYEDNFLTIPIPDYTQLNNNNPIISLIPYYETGIKHSNV